jgi:DNA polymerase-1
MANYTEQDVTRWRYNIKDILYTREIALNLHGVLRSQNPKLQEFYEFQQYHNAPALDRVMHRGIKIDLAKKDELFAQLTALLTDVEKKLEYLIGEPFNPKSLPQIKAVFKDLLGIKPIIDKKTGNESFSSGYMLQYLEQYPMYKPLITLILEYRSIGVFLRTFVSAKVDDDGRMRTSYNIAGTKTYRLSSRKNPFGNGANLANIPSKGKIDLKFSLATIEPTEELESDESFVVGEYEGITKLPNCKEFFIPDDGYTFFNADYSGADAMIVAWDSDCAWLQKFFTTSNEKLYIYIGSHYLQRELTVHDKEYKLYKQFIHGTNYGMMEAKAAANANMPLDEARKLRQWYFKLCPEIPQWHKRIASDISSRGYVENIFGARGYFMNKDSPTLLNQAYAFIPQSTIAILVNKGLVNIDQKEKDIQVLLQVHDALAGQFKTTDLDAPSRIVKHMSVELPYKRPLVIPVDITTSARSYGDC